MDAIIGRYKAHVEESGLIIRHPTGISFDFTVDEALGMLDFLHVYRNTLLNMQHQQDTEPAMQSVNIEEDK
ncbi:MAG TPA: hypothetical protein VKR06_08110 [Ktedonosporobacter sp.]|nr:hypothetical protein [Ktedonosporobacter sp.]